MAGRVDTNVFELPLLECPCLCLDGPPPLLTDPSSIFCHYLSFTAACFRYLESAFEHSSCQIPAGKLIVGFFHLFYYGLFFHLVLFVQCVDTTNSGTIPVVFLGTKLP